MAAVRSSFRCGWFRANNPNVTTARRRFGYAFGHAGLDITLSIVTSIALYFYLPPPGSGLSQPLSNDVLFGVFTVFGAAMLLGRIVDGVSDPIIGYLSDHSRSRWGRRRFFMMLGVGPMVALPVWLFYPPGDPGSTTNAVFLMGVLSLYFLAFTVYVAPYLALIPDLAPEQVERVRLSRLLALVQFPVVAVFGLLWAPVFAFAKSADLDPLDAIRWIVIASSLLAAVFSLLPIGLTFCAGIIIGLIQMPRLVHRVGPKYAMITCCLVFGLSLLPLIALSPDTTGGPADMRNWMLLLGVLFFAGFPVAGFFVLPNVLISQLIDADAADTGTNRAATYFGMQGLTSKISTGVSAALLGWLFVRFGNSPDDAGGVLGAAPLCSVFCVLAAGLYLRYPEQQVLKKGTQDRVRNGR